MDNKWANQFTKKLQDKEQASQENVKNAKVYQEATAKLFERLEKKVKEVQAISVSKTGLNPKTLNLKCHEKLLSMIPEGINVDSSRGRIRVKHNCKNLCQFIYLNLMTDPTSQAIYPENLMWVVNWNGTATDVQLETLPRFDDIQFEHLIEVCFLE